MLPNSYLAVTAAMESAAMESAAMESAAMESYRHGIRDAAVESTAMSDVKTTTVKPTETIWPHQTTIAPSTPATMTPSTMIPTTPMAPIVMVPIIVIWPTVAITTVGRIDPAAVAGTISVTRRSVAIPGSSEASGQTKHRDDNRSQHHHSKLHGFNASAGGRMGAERGLSREAWRPPRLHSGRRPASLLHKSVSCQVIRTAASLERRSP